MAILANGVKITDDKSFWKQHKLPKKGGCIFRTMYCSNCACSKAYLIANISYEITPKVTLHSIEGFKCDACGNIDPVIPHLGVLVEKHVMMPEVTNWYWQNDQREWVSFKKEVVTK